MTLTKSISLVALGTALLLLIPLMANRYVEGANWSPGDFVFAAVLLFGSGTTFVLIARKWDSLMYRLGVGLAVAAGLMLVWANAAVGLVGSEDNPANLLYAGVLLVALIGAFMARFRPLGMSNAMFAASLTYVLVTVVALFVWKPEVVQLSRREWGDIGKLLLVKWIGFLIADAGVATLVVVVVKIVRDAGLGIR